MAVPPDARSFLPLTPAVFHILLALADEDRHGYAIAQEVERATRGRVTLGPGTLYGTLDRAAAAGLVAETGERAKDRRRVYFTLTALGRAVAREEARRLAELVDLARAKSVLTRSRS
ncbi:MAG: PadR family transcriptional regulator [Vicinamibacterales bacterium]